MECMIQVWTCISAWQYWVSETDVWDGLQGGRRSLPATITHSCATKYKLAPWHQILTNRSHAFYPDGAWYPDTICLTMCFVIGMWQSGGNSVCLHPGDVRLVVVPRGAIPVPLSIGKATGAGMWWALSSCDPSLWPQPWEQGSEERPWHGKTHPGMRSCFLWGWSWNFKLML